jgi:hypothetical protein
MINAGTPANTEVLKCPKGFETLTFEAEHACQAFRPESADRSRQGRGVIAVRE